MNSVIDAPGWVIIIGAFFVGATQLATIVMQARAEKKADIVKMTLEDATERAEIQRADQTKLAVSTHKLVNSNMGVQLRLHRDTSRRLAMLTKDPADVQAAALAEKLYAEHEAANAVANQS